MLCPPIPRRCWPSPLPEEVAAGLDRVLSGIRKSPQAIPPPPPRNLSREPLCYPSSAGGTRSGPGGLLGGDARHRHVPLSFPSPGPLPPLPFLFSVPLDSSPESPKPRGASRLACPLALPRPLWTGMVLPRLPPPPALDGCHVVVPARALASAGTRAWDGEPQDPSFRAAPHCRPRHRTCCVTCGGMTEPQFPHL